MTGEPTIRIEADPEAASRAAAEAIALALREAVEERGRADWATTGGSTPVGIYRALAAPPLLGLVPWAAVHVWWGDDRFVPRDDPLSNVLPFDRELLPHVPLAAANVHVPKMAEALEAGLGAESVAAAYEMALVGTDLPADDRGFPILDVVLVGIGGDGHVLSVFPGSPLFDAEDWVSPVPAPTHIEPHVARVSLHPRILESARLPMVVAHGAGKAAILASVLGPERDERRWPAQIARRAGAIWLLDRAAAASLR
ncbi:MAG: 6-phosphogluconolactonase [Chloroflexi bacterium]|nr:6-phosphogluconolactonase [Chloroflexota bacterium]